MSLWHAVTDSDAFRWFAKRGPARPFFRSRAFHRLDLARRSALSRHAVRRDSALFGSVRTFCLFIGHNKSGSSLVGGLLDAHPNVILSDEVDALKYVDAGFERDQIFHVLLRGSRSEARKGRVTARRLQPYSYWVPGGWQGRVTEPLVVGDSTTGTSTRRLGTDPDLLSRLDAVMRSVDVRLIHIIRNPFDPISVMMVRGGRSFRNAIDHYFGACETLARMRRTLDRDRLFPVRYEAFVSDPEESLRAVCGFVGVDADEGYLTACGSIIRRRPDRSRELVEWVQPWIDEVERRMSNFDFLKGYSHAG